MTWVCRVSGWVERLWVLWPGPAFRVNWERERERERETRLRPWDDTGQHPQTSMGWPKRKNYTHSFNAFYIIHIHFDILQGRRLTHSPRNDSHFLGFYFSPLIPYIFHSVRSAVDVFLVPNIARHSEFYGKMLNHCGWKVWEQPRPKNQNKTRVKVETWLNKLRGSGRRRRGCVWWLPRRRGVCQVSAGTRRELCITSDTSQLSPGQ